MGQRAVMYDGPVIRNADDLRHGAACLGAAHPQFAALLEKTGPLPLRLRPPGFKGLLDIVISQQVSTASAAAIHARMEAAALTSPAAVLAAGEEGLRAAGLSRPKVRYALGLAREDLDYDALQRLSDGAAAARLVAITGIGPWTAQIYLMFCLGRPDAFPAGDLALQEAAKVLFDLPGRPDAATLAILARAWSPWRSVAARALFAYYRLIKKREGFT